MSEDGWPGDNLRSPEAEGDAVSGPPGVPRGGGKRSLRSDQQDRGRALEGPILGNIFVKSILLISTRRAAPCRSASHLGLRLAPGRCRRSRTETPPDRTPRSYENFARKVF